jgi:hypothetical protein
MERSCIFRCLVTPQGIDNSFFSLIHQKPRYEQQISHPPSAAIPEPSSIAVLSLGLLGFYLARRKPAKIRHIKQTSALHSGSPA